MWSFLTSTIKRILFILAVGAFIWVGLYMWKDWQKYKEHSANPSSFAPRTQEHREIESPVFMNASRFANREVEKIVLELVTKTEQGQTWKMIDKNRDYPSKKYTLRYQPGAGDTHEMLEPPALTIDVAGHKGGFEIHATSSADGLNACIDYTIKTEDILIQGDAVTLAKGLPTFNVGPQICIPRKI